jgi:glycosyltransferase involved in cell wall biosynthesis
LKHLSSLKELFNNPLIHRLGFVDGEDLPYLYNLATIYCQPSFAEGFGLCPLEAMQSGTPVVYSRETSIPEIMGEAGISFDPYIPSTLSKALSNLWNSPTLQKTQSKLGIKQASVFSWQQTAIQTLEIYALATSS